MINKKKPPDKNQEEQVYKIIKCPLKSVLKEYTKLQPIIDDVVKDINKFVIIGYQFIRLYLLDKFYNNKQIEAKLDVLDFIKYKYKVTLGPTSWEIAKLSGKLVNKDELFKDLNKKYDYDFIINLIDEWFDNEMIRITETSTLHFN
jgi:hypothetical protein